MCRYADTAPPNQSESLNLGGWLAKAMVINWLVNRI